MATRREVLELALGIERGELWADLYESYGDDKFSARTANLIRRIRVVSEALGYPTPVEAIAIRWLWLYQFVETVPALGITAQWFDAEAIEGYEERIERIPDEVHSMHRWSFPAPVLGGGS